MYEHVYYAVETIMIPQIAEMCLEVTYFYISANATQIRHYPASQWSEIANLFKH